MSEHENGRPGEYGFDLWCSLEGAIDMYEQDRQQYWKSRVGSAEWSPLEQLRAEADEIADLIRNRALTLKNIGTISDLNTLYQLHHHLLEEVDSRWDGKLEVLKAAIRKAEPKDKADRLIFELELGVWDDDARDDPGRLVWESLCIADAWHVVLGMRDRVRRIWELERLVYKFWTHGSPSRECARFLELVSRTYIYGLFPECVAMCRAGMEQVFRERVSTEDCARAGQADDLDGRINAAFHVQVGFAKMDADLFQAAHAVRQRGNKVLHGDPDVPKDALGTIEQSLRVIAAISASST